MITPRQQPAAHPLPLLSLALLLLISLPNTLPADPSETGQTFAHALETALAGDPQAASRQFQELLANGHTSANLFYNLGNALFQSGQPGPALVAFERSLLIDPNHNDALHNLAFTRRTLSLPAWTPLEIAALRFGDRFATWTGALTLWLGILALLACRKPSVRPLKILLALLAFTWTTLAAAALWWQWNHLTGPNLAIVTEPATLHHAPAATGSQAGQATIGQRITILATRGDWIFARLPTGTRAWLPAESVTPIRFPG